MTAILVLTNLPDQTSAQQLAETLITEKLAACVNILSPCQSIYHWEGKIESAEEWPMMIKTTTDRYAQLEIRILSLHPYELPEIIQVEIKGGSNQYIQWVHQETAL